MLNYRWPGNIRELENVIRKLVVFRDPDLVARELNAISLRKPVLSASATLLVGGEAQAVGAAESISTPILEQVTKAKHQAETEAILAALNSTHWNRKQAAALLKIDYKALLYKMKKLGVESDVPVPGRRPRRRVPGDVRERGIATLLLPAASARRISGPQYDKF